MSVAVSTQTPSQYIGRERVNYTATATTTTTTTTTTTSRGDEDLKRKPKATINKMAESTGSNNNNESNPSPSNKSPSTAADDSPTIDRIPVEMLNPLKAGAKSTAPLIQGSVTKESAIETHANIYGLSSEKEKSIRRLYDRLDMDNDGSIDIRDLTTALKHEVPHIPSRMAPQLFRRINRDNGGPITLNDFTNYVVEHEKRLADVFKDLDRNQDGYIDVREIRNYCDELGLPISDAKLNVIVDQMDQTGSASIDLSEFQDYMLLYPSADLREIVDFWRHNLVIDIGEDSQVPEDFTPAEISSGVWWRHLVAGGIAGCMSRTCTAPLDRLKVFLQVHASHRSPYSLFSALRYLHQEGGIKSFWRGNGINVMKIAPESAIKFMAYEQMKRIIQNLKRSRDLTIVERFGAGSSAGVISQTIIYPLEVLKTRLALRKSGQMDKGLLHFTRTMYRNEGLVCFYKGYVPNLIGIIPYAGIDLAIYETLKSIYVKRNPDLTEPGVLALLACGTCSSTCGQLTSYPLALIRTRLQARAISNDTNQPDTMSGQFRYIYRNEGLSGLYRGITPNFMKVVPAVSISYVVYEMVRRQLGAPMS